MSLYTEITNFKIWSDIFGLPCRSKVVQLFLFIQHASYTSYFTDVGKEGIRFIEQYMQQFLIFSMALHSTMYTVNSRNTCKSCYYKCNNCHRIGLISDRDNGNLLHSFRWNLNDTFARNTGYNEVGELNNIIIIYPQVMATDVNPLGCWDGWAYNVHYYGNEYTPSYRLLLRVFLEYLLISFSG